MSWWTGPRWELPLLPLKAGPELVGELSSMLGGPPLGPGRIAMIIKQLDIGAMDNFSYIVGCEATGKALVIDPGHDVARIAATAMLSPKGPS